MAVIVVNDFEDEVKLIHDTKININYSESKISFQNLKVMPTNNGNPESLDKKDFMRSQDPNCLYFNINW